MVDAGAQERPALNVNSQNSSWVWRVIDMVKITPEIRERIRAIRKPPLDFEIPDALKDKIFDLIDCLEREDWLHLDIYEDTVHSYSRDLKDVDKQEWIIDYYSNRGWLEE
jgi:hypothetical protein